jgi:hypothetical protein
LLSALSLVGAPALCCWFIGFSSALNAWTRACVSVFLHHRSCEVSSLSSALLLWCGGWGLYARCLVDSLWFVGVLTSFVSCLLSFLFAFCFEFGPLFAVGFSVSPLP